ncbi:MAG: hypothetical protein AAFX54_13075 [Pseudomonadota bacterium]
MHFGHSSFALSLAASRRTIEIQYSVSGYRNSADFAKQLRVTVYT